MGYAFYDKSGTFDPEALGLNVGDTINVVVVGAGGGGCSGYFDSSYGKNGGDGGSSSFGSYCTAIGGQGGRSTNSAVSYVNYQYIGGRGFHYQGGAGAGGYIPGTTEWGGNGLDAIRATGSLAGLLTFDTPYVAGSAGCSGAYFYNNNNSGTISFKINPVSKFCSGFALSYSQSAATHLKGNPGLLCGGGAGYSVPNGVQVGGGGGSGYGAGGGSGGANLGSYNGYGGCSGQVRRASIKLASLNSIAVTVGGGGSGAGYSIIGNNGAGGRAGIAAGAGGGAGGYGGVPGFSGSSYSGSSTGYNVCAGGGGGGGCVEVFW